MKQTKGNKHHIIKDITDNGISFRKASKALDQVIKSWSDALWCGEDVDVPGGILQVKYADGIQKERLQSLRNISTTEPTYLHLDFRHLEAERNRFDNYLY